MWKQESRDALHFLGHRCCCEPGASHKWPPPWGCQETRLENKLEAAGGMWKEHQSPLLSSPSFAPSSTASCLTHFLSLTPHRSPPVSPQGTGYEVQVTHFLNDHHGPGTGWCFATYYILYYLISLVEQTCEVSILCIPVLGLTLLRLPKSYNQLCRTLGFKFRFM